MQRFWDVEKYCIKNTVENLAVSNIFLNTHTHTHTHYHLDNPTRPRLPSAVEKAANIVSFLNKQTLSGQKKHCVPDVLCVPAPKKSRNTLTVKEIQRAQPFNGEKGKSLLRHLINPSAKHLSQKGSILLTKLFIQNTIFLWTKVS